MSASTLTNTATRYGGVTKTFHWLTALLILTAIPLGLIAEELPYGTSDELARKALLFSLHKTVGVLAFLVAAARILWALSQPKPGLLHPDRKAEALAAETVHWALYGAMLLVPLSGWLHHAASEGFAPIWLPFGQSLPFVPKSPAVAGFFGAWHEVFTKVLFAAIALHIAGAIKHHVIDRDATLKRMLFGTTEAEVPPQTHARTPLFAALGIWVLAMGLGSALGLSHGDHDHAPAAALEAVPSDWTVTDGTLAISVTQMGSPVAGQFGDWTASIAFDPETTAETVGHTTVTIATGSLTLGSVTDQATGTEFLNAAEFPTATFDADLKRAAEGSATGYVADGTLTIRGETIPVTLPFDLALEGDTAQATGGLTLDRRDFAIGTRTYADEGSVAFAVAVTIDLTATRAAQ